MESFPEYLQRLRAHLKLSYRDASAKTGISTAYLQQLEHGTRGTPKPDILKKLALAYGISVKEMMQVAGYLDDPNPPKSTLTDQEEIELAFSYVMNDPRYQWGARLSGRMDLEVKRFIVKMYEQATGKKLLPGE